MGNLYSLLLMCFLFAASAFGDLYLKDNLKRAVPGDYLVTIQNKTYTILHIFEKKDPMMTIEEISIPATAIKNPDCFSWKEWVKNEAPEHTAWVVYRINLDSAIIQDYYSFTKNAWYNTEQQDNFLSKLLNLKLTRVPFAQMKKVGPAPISGFPDLRKPWQPKLIANGQVVEGVHFAAWRTTWPKDQSELSGKTIEVYVPEENERYPSYFPYWLQISGTVGKATLRIVDSGSNLKSPKQVINNLPTGP